MAAVMLERGHNVIALVGGEGPVTGQLAAAGVPFRSLEFLRRPIHPYHDYRALSELAATLRDWHPDLVSAHTAKAGWLGRAACARLDLPCIYTAHGWSIGTRISRAQGALYSRAERIAARWSDAIICVCEHERQLALEKEIAPTGKLHVVHNGVRDIGSALRARPGNHPVRILSVARFEPPKDHETLLHALHGLNDLPWELQLAGDGPLAEKTQARARELGFAGRVRLSGYTPDPAPLYAAAQVFVLSSRSEGFPRSILEAMRAGLPVIASDVGGVAEAVSDGKNGLLADPAGVESMRAALRTMIVSAAARERFGCAARRVYENKFRLERTVERTAAVYDSVLRARAGAAAGREFHEV
jgi:glycosyltransferase involved in cell wall biosynthesis